MSQNRKSPSPEVKFDPEVGREVDASTERFFAVDGKLGRIYASLDEDLQPNTGVEFFDVHGDVERTLEVERVFYPDDKITQTCVASALEKLDAEAQVAGGN